MSNATTIPHTPRSMFAWLRQRRSPIAIPDAKWTVACRDIAWTHGLDPLQNERLREHTGRFLRDKRFSAAAGLELDDEDCLRLAILACLPVLALGYEWLRGWHEVIVYPGQFRVQRENEDEESGVVSQSHDWLAGESWLQGPLILSLDDVAFDLAHPYDGNNLVAHEIAHKLDMLDGGSNGVPPLPPDRRQRWLSVFQTAYEAFCAEVEAERETWLDPYAAEAPDEFFAVTSEAYFSDPWGLAEVHPDVHRELRAFYGIELQAPAAA